MPAAADSPTGRQESETKSDQAGAFFFLFFKTILEKNRGLSKTGVAFFFFSFSSSKQFVREKGLSSTSVIFYFLFSFTRLER